jgi:hypothetical protein
MLRSFEPRTIAEKDKVRLFCCQNGKWKWVTFVWSFGRWVSTTRCVRNMYGIPVQWEITKAHEDLEKYQGWAK